MDSCQQFDISDNGKCEGYLQVVGRAHDWRENNVVSEESEAFPDQKCRQLLFDQSGTTLGLDFENGHGEFAHNCDTKGGNSGSPIYARLL